MKRVLSIFAAVAVLAGVSGCGCLPQCMHFPGFCLGRCCDGVRNCAACLRGCGPCGGAACADHCGYGSGLCGQNCGGPSYQPVAPGPPSGAVTYPYYTNRGPRDFLAEDPPSIGP